MLVQAHPEAATIDFDNTKESYYQGRLKLNEEKIRSNLQVAMNSAMLGKKDDAFRGLFASLENDSSDLVTW